MRTMRELNRHPCFNMGAKSECGRVHLPVAPKCNILCNYCNRKFDCVNESRPGVTSAVLPPAQAIAYLERVLEAEPRIAVAGIAGPGDPFANPRETMEILRLIRRRFPELLLCLASNGLGLPPYLDELAEHQVSHVTVTVNAVDPDIGTKIYSWVRDGKQVHRGRKAAEVLLSRQLKAIAGLKDRGMVVKVNTIVIPGINDRHVEAVARKMKELRVDLLNCMPVYPNADTPFGHLHEPGPEQMAEIRAEAEEFVPQMRHCTRCRADAVGLLNEDRTEELRDCLSACSQLPPPMDETRPYVAVATREGALVNLHLGEAGSFQIWGPNGRDFRLLEERPAPPAGGGDHRWWALAEILKDCRAVLVSAIGETPKAILTEAGTLPLEMSGLIEMGLQAVYEGNTVSFLKARRGGLAKGCQAKGLGSGCG
ncbi:MAG: radical SAM protein [Deltaproteobacteria bacterium]|nr:radical SAM protein [Deltaproteobacteria bacterium]